MKSNYCQLDYWPGCFGKLLDNLARIHNDIGFGQREPCTPTVAAIEPSDKAKCKTCPQSKAKNKVLTPSPLELRFGWKYPAEENGESSTGDPCEKETQLLDAPTTYAACRVCCRDPKRSSS
jgi:hypothetical protein